MSERDKMITMRSGMKDFFFLFFSALDKALWHGAGGMPPFSLKQTSKMRVTSYSVLSIIYEIDQLSGCSSRLLAE